MRKLLGTLAASIALGMASASALAGDIGGAQANASIQFLVTGQGVNWNSANVTDASRLWNWNVNSATGDFNLAADWQWTSAAQGLNGRPAFTLAMEDELNGGNFDPFISWGYTATNNTGAAMNFTQVFEATITPTISEPVIVQNRIGGSLTNGEPGVNDVGVVPTNASGKVSDFFLSSDNGATWVNVGVNAGDAQNFSSTTTDTFLYGTFFAGPSGFATGAPWNRMRVVTSFALSGGSDVASFSGRATVTPIPEPEQIALLALGLGLAGFIARRRRLSA